MVLIYVTAEGPRSENFSATPTEQPEKKTSVSLRVLPLTGSEYQMCCCCWGLRVRKKKEKQEWECTLARKKKKKKDFFLKRINLQSTRRWSISVWLNRWLLISMVTRWSVLRCQPAPVSKCVAADGVAGSTWLQEPKHFKAWERTRVRAGDRLCFNVNTLPLFFFFIVLKENALYSSAHLKKLSFHQSAVCVWLCQWICLTVKKKKISYCATAWGVLECRSERPQGPS